MKKLLKLEYTLYLNSQKNFNYHLVNFILNIRYVRNWE